MRCPRNISALVDSRRRCGGTELKLLDRPAYFGESIFESLNTLSKAYNNRAAANLIGLAAFKDLSPCVESDIDPLAGILIFNVRLRTLFASLCGVFFVGTTWVALLKSEVLGGMTWGGKRGAETMSR